MTAVRKNKVLSMAEKFRLIQGYEDGLSVRHLQDLFQCGKTQIYETLKRRHDIRQEYGDAYTGKVKRAGKTRETVSDVVDGVVWTWYVESKSKDLAVSGHMIRDKARSVAGKLDHDNFDVSGDWLDSFLKKHNVSRADLAADRSGGNRVTDMEILPTRSPSVEALDIGGSSGLDQVRPDVSHPQDVQQGDGSGCYMEPLSSGPYHDEGRFPSPQPDLSFSVLRTRTLDDDAHDHFVRFVDSTLRSITPDYRKDLARLEIQQVLIKYKHSVDVPLGPPSFTTLPTSTTSGDTV